MLFWYLCIVLSSSLTPGQEAFGQAFFVLPCLRQGGKDKAAAPIWLKSLLQVPSFKHDWSNPKLALRSLSWLLVVIWSKRGRLYWTEDIVRALECKNESGTRAYSRQKIHHLRHFAVYESGQALPLSQRGRTHERRFKAWKWTPSKTPHLKVLFCK